MKLSDLKQAYPPVSAEGHAQFIRTLSGLKEEEPVRKKLTLSLALALVLVLALAATAIALVATYSVKDKIDPKFADQVTEINEKYENDYLTLSINDALASAKSLFVAMNMAPKEGADPVFVFPIVTAESKGQQLDVDIESGFEVYDGVWLPERTENHEGKGNFSLDLAIMEDLMPGAKDDITWTITFHVLKPNWPVEEDPHTSKGYFDRETITEEAHKQLFLDAYKNNKILLTYGDTTVEYGAYLPTPEGITDEDFIMMRQWERLVRSGAFNEVDRVSRSFVTPKGERKDFADEKQSFDFADYTLTVDKVSLTPLEMEARFTVTAKHKNVLEKNEVLYFEAKTEDGTIISTGSGLSFGKSGQDTEPMAFVGLYDTKPLKELPNEITFVPYIKKSTPTAPGQNPTTEITYQPENSFTVKVGQ